MDGGRARKPVGGRLPGDLRDASASGHMVGRRGRQHQTRQHRSTRCDLSNERVSVRGARQRPLQDELRFDDLAADQVFLDDPLEYRRVARAIPGPFRIHHRDRPALADPETIGLGAQDAPLLG